MEGFRNPQENWINLLPVSPASSSGAIFEAWNSRRTSRSLDPAEADAIPDFLIFFSKKNRPHLRLSFVGISAQDSSPPPLLSTSLLFPAHMHSKPKSSEANFRYFEGKGPHESEPWVQGENGWNSEKLLGFDRDFWVKLHILAKRAQNPRLVDDPHSAPPPMPN